MAAVSRRSFLSLSGTLALAVGLPHELLAPALAEPAAPADVPTTLRETIRQSTTGNKGYRTLVSAPGEPFIVREDLLGKAPSDARTSARRSIAYLGHTSDIHIQDTQSPARLEPVNAFTTTLIPGSHRPQEAMTLFVQAQMVKSFNDAAFSPVTGAAMAAVVNTGDSADQISNREASWYIKIMDGGKVLADTGTKGVYEGVQVWSEAAYAYHPDDPSQDMWGAYGFPRIPGLMKAIVNTEVESMGMPAPWYSVYGNHDVLFNGFAGQDDSLRSLATGSRKYYSFEFWALDHFTGMSLDVSPLQRALNFGRQQLGIMGGYKEVGADPERKLIEGQDFMRQHFDSPDNPGPVGHGWTQANLDENKTYWTADIGPHLRLFGLDTCNRLTGADGAVPKGQFDWLEAGLQKCLAEKKLAVILSHHNSITLGNTAESVFHPGEELIHADEFLDMLVKYPNMIMWLNGHTHTNTVKAHKGKDGKGGFWEVTTASCVDYPQQQQVVDIVDNRDGTISLFAVTMDHASPAAWRQGDLSQTGIASLSRELSSNDWVATPLALRGSPLDRNVELLLAAPFDMSTIKDTELDALNMARKAKVLARKAGKK